MSSVQLPPDTAEDPYELPHVPSRYDGRTIRKSEHFVISAYWFATNFLWGALLVIILPENLKNLYPYARVPALSLFTAFAAIIAIVSPLYFGALSDRCASKWGRRRPFIGWGVGINILGLALMALTYYNAAPVKDPTWENYGFFRIAGLLLASPQYLLFLGAYMVVQLGNNIASAAYMGVIPDIVPEDQRGAASGYMALMSQLGTLLGAVGCGLLLGKSPAATKYALLAVVLLVVGVLTLIGLKENPLPHKPPKILWRPYIKSLWINPKKYPDFAWVWITRALVMLGFYSVLPFINYYLADVVRSTNVAGDAAALTGIILVASSISGIYGGYVSDRIGRKKVVFVANGLIAVMSLAFIFTRSFTEVLAAGSLFGLGFGAYTSVDWALGTDVLPDKKHAAKDMAVWHIAMTLPQTLAAPIAGFMIASFGMTVLVPLTATSVKDTSKDFQALRAHLKPYAVSNVQEQPKKKAIQFEVAEGDFAALIKDKDGSAFMGQTIHVAPSEDDRVIHYTSNGYASVFILCAVCFALGAYFLKNVRGVK